MKESIKVINQAHGNNWSLYNGDSCELLKAIPDASIDFSIFSPPFASLYIYSNTERDLGNSTSPELFWSHFEFIMFELYRVMKEGRIVAVHVQQIALQKAKDGVIGVYDFRGDTIRNFVANDFIYQGEYCIDTDPQATAIRQHTKGLAFVQLHKDSTWMRPAFADYILLFRMPGENKVPVIPDVTNEEWIKLAHPVWYDIRRTNTLNAAEAKDNDDERHTCPLQLDTIEKCIKLYTNKGENVLTPFAGIGSEVYQAVKLGRKGIGIELKQSYYKTAVKNCQQAEKDYENEKLSLYAGQE